MLCLGRPSHETSQGGAGREIITRYHFSQLHILHHKHGSLADGMVNLRHSVLLYELVVQACCDFCSSTLYQREV